MLLKSIDDPRDTLAKARRKELELYARSKGVQEIINDPGMPAILMRQILRQRGFTDIQIPPRVLGQPEGVDPTVETTNGTAVDATEMLKEQYIRTRLADMKMHELRKVAKERGLKLPRTVKKSELLEALNGENAS